MEHFTSPDKRVTFGQSYKVVGAAQPVLDTTGTIALLNVEYCRDHGDTYDFQKELFGFTTDQTLLQMQKYTHNPFSVLL